MDKTNAINAYLQAVDVEYSSRLAKKMETYKTNPVLGFRTAGSPGNRDESRLFQGTQNVADHNGIAASAFRKKAAGHFGNPFRFVNEYQAMNRNGAFHTDLHTAIFRPFKAD